MLRALRTNGPLTRHDLSERLGIKRTTLSEVTSHLIRIGAVRTTRPRPAKGRGRPAELLCLEPGSGQYLGLDFGHQRVHAVIVNASHEVIAAGERGYPESSSLDERLQIAFGLVDSLVAETGASLACLHSIGIGVPGPYTDARLEQNPAPDRTVRLWGAGTRWRKSVSERVQERFQASVLVDNNVRFAGLAESCWDRGTIVDNMVFLKLSDGVGGALVITEQLVRGANGFSGELGHITIDPQGDSCRCGKRGCLETIAASWAILRRAQAKGLAVGSLTDLRAELDRGSALAEEVVREVGGTIGHVLGLACIVLNPAEIIVGGEAAEILPELLVHASATIQKELLPVNETRPEVRRARLGSLAGALGAVAALLHTPSPRYERS